MARCRFCTGAETGSGCWARADLEECHQVRGESENVVKRQSGQYTVVRHHQPPETACICVRLFRILPWVSMAPLATPVVRRYIAAWPDCPGRGYSITCLCPFHAPVPWQAPISVAGPYCQFGIDGKVRNQTFWTPRMMISGNFGKNSGTPARTTSGSRFSGTTSANLSANMSSTITSTLAPESLNLVDHLGRSVERIGIGPVRSLP